MRSRRRCGARRLRTRPVLTEWDTFEQLDYRRVFDGMEKPAFIFDGRNRLDHALLFEIGFNVHAIGKPPLSHL